MKPLDPAQIRASVIAVPPLARRADLSLDVAANKLIVDYLQAGGIRTLLYGGNANFYHLRPSEYRQTLEMLTELTGPDTWTIPSVGPSYGVMVDQAEMLKDFDFPTAMLLPHGDLTTPAGISAAVQTFVATAERPLVLYIKHDGWIDVPTVRSLCDDGLIAMIKYAIVREDSANDQYLRELTDQVDPARIVSGIGEQPATIHLRDFGVAGFTSGCVCVAPALSMKMLAALRSGDFETAESIRQLFLPLEDLRNQIHPIRVLHHAVEL